MGNLSKLLLVFGLIGVLSSAYYIAYKYSEEGWGYPGYNGFSRPHSRWYFKDYTESIYSSAREDSVGGSRFSKKGLSGGK